jgi:hypothetical protein
MTTGHSDDRSRLPHPFRQRHERQGHLSARGIVLVLDWRPGGSPKGCDLVDARHAVFASSASGTLLEDHVWSLMPPNCQALYRKQIAELIISMASHGPVSIRW